MTKKEMLDILRLLSALESWALSCGDIRLPDYLHENISSSGNMLEVYILGEDNE